MIRHPGAFWRFLPDGHDGLFDWDYLQTAWRGKITPMDFDCVVERNGQFLCIETKNNGAPIHEGNARTLQTLIKDPKWTLILVFGKLPEEVREIFVYKRAALVTYIEKATAEDMQRVCGEWRSWAERQPITLFNGVYLGKRPMRRS